MNFWILYLLTFGVYVDSYEDHELLNYSIKNVMKDLRARRIIIYTKSPQHLLLVPTQFIEPLVRQYSTVIVNMNEFSYESSNPRFPLLKEYLLWRSHKEGLNVIFLRIETKGSAVLELLEHITFLTTFLQRVKRAKTLFLVFTTNESSMNLYEFFRHSWGRKFLDIAVIEFIRGSHHSSKLSPLNDTSNPTGNRFRNLMILHQYNPFIDEYKKQILSRSSTLFPNKLQNMYSFRLSTGFYYNSPLVRPIDPSFRSSLPLDGMEVNIAKALAESSNFSFIVRIAGPSPHVLEALQQHSIDFPINTFIIVGPPNHDNSSLEPTAFAYSIVNHLIIKQRPEYRVEFTYETIVLVTVFAIILAIFKLMVKLSKLKSKIWTLYNMIQIILGNSLNFDPTSAGEFILFLSLLYVYMNLSTYILSTLTKINFSMETFKDFQTLKDVVDSGIIPCIPRFYSYVGQFIEDASFHKLLETSADDCLDCQFQLVKGTNVGYEACVVNSITGKAYATIFSRNVNGSIISYVASPLVPTWNTMLLPQTSPYVDRFALLIRRLVDAGFVKLWYDADQNMQTKIIVQNLKGYLVKKQPYAVDLGLNLSLADAWFYTNLTFVLLCTYAVAFGAFVAELGWKWRRGYARRVRTVIRRQVIFVREKLRAP